MRNHRRTLSLLAARQSAPLPPRDDTPAVDADEYAPHIFDQDDPADDGLRVTPEKFAANAKAMFAELEDHSLDGPIAIKQVPKWD